MTAAVKPPRFVFLLNRAQRAVARWIERRPQAWEGISSAQVGLLFLLDKRDDASVGEIAAALEVAPAAVTNLSKRMQAAALVERVGDAQDGRLTRLRLSKDGRQASARAHEVLDALNARLLDGFSADETAVVARWLNHVALVLSEQEDLG
ncbi:MarR family transcriptional regulator [Massilia sp. Dwa41.01b]|uniref:MarR family winged helix-turn-helix transcriptional regulator n=1 Tax=unclassified Massilia TaxID=2609279 RepID=UPI001603A903|nr:MULTISPECIES: MarR family transcriptional regulator [unclassified Massilia]QNA89918.1 MarR family transcriptional regulator [Massilia sp. Dwa41.01b]QNB00803.1 MarR family transcriptional regulator [Massilia sp. Se16.2.3]